MSGARRARLSGGILAAAALLMLLGCVPAPAEPGAPAPAEPGATVTRIVDGDTVELADGTIVRVLGIDTPEVHGGTECWGPEASAFAADTLLGEQVTVRQDPTQDATDRYGRTLAYLILRDGSNYSVEAARAGAAESYVYDDPVAAHDEIVAAQAEARAAGRGLWGACERAG